MRYLAFVAAWCVLLSASIPAEARTQRVQFAPGTSETMLRGSIRGDESAEYILGAGAGQRMVVSLRTSNPSSYFNVTAPGANAAMFIGSTSGNRFETVMPSSGDYRISVYLMRNAARRNETASYTLEVSIVGRGGGSGRPVAPPAPDFADGLTGGPDYWQVIGLVAGDTLNVRNAPTAKAGIVARLAMGEVVRNLGCTMSGGQRWCRIAVPRERTEGWVSGHYLREAAHPGNHPPPPPPRPPNAVARVSTVKCSDSPQQCFSLAAQACRGSYQVLGSESHAGGIVEDRIPGPVTWYSMTFVCGRSDGAMPAFAWRGPAYQPPRPDKPGKGVRVKDMQRYCQGEASAKFKQRPTEIVTYPVEAKPNGGHVVYGQFPPRGKRVTAFACQFDASGEFRRVDKS